MNDFANAQHLFRVALGQLPLVQPQAVLESDTHMATHRGRLRGNFHLTGSCRENRPAILILEQSVGSALHMEHLFRVRADTAEQTRSKEHTSELQSLMRNSYAVFC